jgi:hypothetical protein
MTRFAWPLLLFAAGVVAVFAQIDRQSRYQPAFSPWVPETFASFAMRHQTERAIEQGDRHAALLKARALVSSRPMPAENLRLLAQAQLALDDRESAAQTLQSAALRGWRDLAVQQSMLVLALEAEDHEQTGLRLAAIWALSGDRQLLARYSEPVLRRPAARISFGNALANARWREGFLKNGPLIMNEEVFELTLKDANRAPNDE